MSLSDSPLIDQSAKHSDTSERRLKDILNLESGFICRTEIPDKGCDFLVELILNDKDSSAWRFPIQLKSVEKLNTISEGKFISYSFPTSRLGYLLRHIPTPGIIVLYSVEENKCFYEFTDKIFSTLLETKDTAWQENDSVSIWIPSINILNAESGKIIHSHFNEAFLNYEKMKMANAKKYGLPSYNLSKEFKYDFNNTEHLKKLLKDYGAIFLSSYDLGIIYNALSKLTLKDIDSDKELLIIAAITYGEVGRNLESELYLSKVKRKYEITSSEETTLKYVEVKNKLNLGQITTHEFIEQLESLKSSLNPSNQILIRINILRYRLIKKSILTQYEKVLIDENDNIFKSIDKIELDEKNKNLFRIWNLENKSIIINNELGYNLGTYKIKSDLGGDISIDAKRKIITEHMEVETKFLNDINTIFKNAVAESEKLLQAHALSTRVTHFLSQQFVYLSQDFENTKSYTSVEYLKSIFSFSFNAYTLFAELELLKDANYNLNNCISILELSEHLHKENVSETIQELSETKAQLEVELDIDPADTPMKALINKLIKNEQESTTQNWAVLKNLSDEVLKHLARTSLEGLNLPEDRFKNILNELMAYRTFHQSNLDDDIEIHPMNQTSDKKDIYKSPVYFVLRNKKNGRLTPPNHSIQNLLLLIPFLKK